MSQLQPNSLIQGRYLIVQMIGEGGMGEVYLAVDQRQGTAIALKRTVLTGDPALAAAFEREGAMLMGLDHPVLAKFVDQFMDGGDHYLLMQHVSGEDFKKRLENSKKPFPIGWVMYWADQLLDALNYLHSQEPPIIHRDIKPVNLKLREDNHIMLLDFGLSREFQKAGSSSSESPSTAYISAEQLRGTGTDARTDIYSLSATIYHLLANKAPVNALNRAEAIGGGSPDPLVAISDINADVSRPVYEVILRGLELNQEDRFGNAHEMQRALRRAFNESKSRSEAKTRVLDTNVVTDKLSETPTAEMETMSETADTADVEQANITTAVFDVPSVATSVAASENVPDIAPEPKPEPQTAAATATFPDQGQQRVYQPVVEAKPRKSRQGMVAAVLGVLVLFAAIVGVGGWYGYTRYYLPRIAEVPPTPNPTAAPSPQPTAEIAVQENVPANTASTPATSGNSNNAVVTTTVPTPAPKTATNRSQPPGPKATPKGKNKDERTVILQ